MRRGRNVPLASRGGSGAALALAVGLVLTGCGGSGDDVAAGATQPVTSAAATPSAETPTTTDGPPAEAPDPCTLLTPEQAATLGGVSPLTAAPSDPTGSSPKACVWSGGSEDAEIVRLEVGLLYPPSPDDLAAMQEQYLEVETGEPVAGVGDGAEVYMNSPVTIVGVSGYVTYRLSAYNGTPTATTLLTEAARQVVAAVQAG
jgi:Protein of unknown function (DUF3558)